MSDLPHIIAQMRRLYHHMIHGGQITADDMSRVIQRLERVAVHPSELPDHLKAAIRDAKVADEHAGLNELCSCGDTTIEGCAAMPSRHCGAWRDDGDV